MNQGQVGDSGNSVIYPTGGYFGPMQFYVRFYIDNIPSTSLQIKVMARALRTGKENPYQEYMQILSSVYFCTFQHEKSSVC